MDRRDRDHKWFHSFDERRMVIVVHEGDDADQGPLEVPAVFEVCSTCEGQGKHVNPAIDSNGLSAEDFDRDPDFEEDYFSGRYDVPCHECHGRRVVPVIAENCDPVLKAKAEKWMEEFYDYQREIEAERRMGC
jgi:hypothetical protein